MYQSTYKGSKIYTSKSHDRSNKNHCWFTEIDGNSSGCSFVMDNKQFDDLLIRGLVSEPLAI